MFIMKNVTDIVCDIICRLVSKTKRITVAFMHEVLCLFLSPCYRLPGFPWFVLAVFKALFKQRMHIYFMFLALTLLTA